jgi:hypothetical protein
LDCCVPPVRDGESPSGGTREPLEFSEVIPQRLDLWSEFEREIEDPGSLSRASAGGIAKVGPCLEGLAPLSTAGRARWLNNHFARLALVALALEATKLGR